MTLKLVHSVRETDAYARDRVLVETEFRERKNINAAVLAHVEAAVEGRDYDIVAWLGQQIADPETARIAGEIATSIVEQMHDGNNRAYGIPDDLFAKYDAVRKPGGTETTPRP